MQMGPNLEPKRPMQLDGLDQSRKSDISQESNEKFIHFIQVVLRNIRTLGLVCKTFVVLQLWSIFMILIIIY